MIDHRYVVKISVYLLLSVSIVILCCKKSNIAANTNVVTCNTTYSYKIAFNGFTMPNVDAMSGDTINFQADTLASGSNGSYTYQPADLAGCNVLWNFGDGKTSTMPSPNHVYDSSGTYTVQMILNEDSVHTNTSKIYIGPSPIYTHLIAGTKQWKRTRVVTDGPTAISDTTIIDTTFTIILISMKKISIGYTQLDYSPGSSKRDLFVYLCYGGGSPICFLNFNPITKKIQYVVVYGWWMTDTFDSI